MRWQHVMIVMVIGGCSKGQSAMGSVLSATGLVMQAVCLKISLKLLVLNATIVQNVTEPESVKSAMGRVR